MKRALVVVDMQNDFVNGLLGTKEAQDIVHRIDMKISDYKEKYLDLIFTRDTHDAGYLYTQEGKNLPVTHCIKHTPGWEIVKEFQKHTARAQVIESVDDFVLSSNTSIINKNTFASRLLCEKLAQYEYTDVEFVGVCTDICVISNVLAAKMFNPEIHIKVDARCCAGTTPEKHKAAIEVMKSCLIDVVGAI